MDSSKTYRGRFAPSPTGPLHFGSLIAATGSYLQAKHQQGEWLIRIDDIDPPREQKGAADQILKTLEGFGFEWDSEVLYQNSREQYYQDAVSKLLKHNAAYACDCSRASILKKTGQAKNNIVYPGFCQNKSLPSSAKNSVRLRCNNKVIHFDDTVQGKQQFALATHIGDFILQRREHLFSYHLASGIDDGEQRITQVVRGADLLSCTPAQIHVQQVLNLSSPQYCHLPIAVDEKGQKLSKQAFSAPIEVKHSTDLLYKTLKFLGQLPPIDLIEGNQKDIWCWAKENWRLDLVPLKKQITIK